MLFRCRQESEAGAGTNPALKLSLMFLGVVGGGGRGGVGGLLVLGGVVGETVDDLDTDLLGEGELHSLAGGGGQAGHALAEGLADILDLRDGDALLLGQVLAGDPRQGDGLVDTGLDGLGVGDGDNGDVVASLLGDLLAVVVAVAVAVAVLGGLAHGHHLGLALLLEGDLDGLGGGLLVLGLVGVAAHLVVDLLDALSAHGAGDGVALLDVLDGLAAQLDVGALGGEGGGADLGSLNHVQDGAVVLGVFVSVVGGGVVGRLVVGGLVVGGLVVGRGGGVLGGRQGGASHSENCQNLHVC